MDYVAECTALCCAVPLALARVQCSVLCSADCNAECSAVRLVLTAPDMVWQWQSRPASGFRHWNLTILTALILRHVGA